MPPKSLTGRVLSESVIEVHGIPHRQVIYEGGRTYLEPLAKPREKALEGSQASLAARQARREYGRRKRESGG